jgi:glutathione S-transferase
MMKVWGRRDGSNVVKTMWCIGELGLEHERIDWGGKFGGNDDPQYRAMNPMGRLPTIQCDDGFVLWESGAIIRYLCATHSAGNLSPLDLQERARAERWMDWSSLYLSSFNGVYLDQYFRLPANERDESKVLQAIKDATPLLDILDAQLAGKNYLNGDSLTIADFPAGSLIHRWMTWSPQEARPSHSNVESWYARLCERPAYQLHVVEATNKRT